jgi:hypothetical protein
MPKQWTRKKWTVNELDKFNIRINTVDTRAFFGFSDLPAPAISPESIMSTLPLAYSCQLAIIVSLPFYSIPSLAKDMTSPVKS